MPRPRAYWIRLEDGVHDHPKTVQLSLSLGIGREQTVGHLTRLWLWLLRYRQTGVLEGVSDELLGRPPGGAATPPSGVSNFDVVNSSRVQIVLESEPTDGWRRTVDNSARWQESAKRRGNSGGRIARV